jgi:glycine betaine/proline transport system substrate-binding protein
MPVQLFQEEVFKKDQPGSYFFKNFNLEEEQLYEVMSAIADKEKEAGATEWYEANKVVDSWME